VEAKKTNLSATAKPFEFKPMATSFEPSHTLINGVSTSESIAIHNPIAIASKPPLVSPQTRPTPAIVPEEEALVQSSAPTKASVPAQTITLSIPIAPLASQAVVPVKPSAQLQKESGGLAASRWGPREPSPVAASNPTTPAVALTPVMPAAPKLGESVRNFEHNEPSYQEIDAVMKQLNGDDSDIGVERSSEYRPSPARAIISALPGRLPSRSLSRELAQTRSPPHRLSPGPESHPHAFAKVVTASPNRLQQPFQYLPEEREYGSSDSAAARLVARNARFSPSFKPQRHQTSGFESPIHRLNRDNKGSISEWDDAVSSGEEAKFHARSGFFDHRVNDLIASVVQEQLQPLGKNLASITASLARMSSRSGSRFGRSASADVEHSDADDEDDEATSQVRAMSPLKDRRFDKLKAGLLEIISTQQPQGHSMELLKLTETLADLKTKISEYRTTPVEDIRGIVSHALAVQIHEYKASVDLMQESQVNELTKISSALGELRNTTQELRAEPSESIRATVEEAVAKEIGATLLSVDKNHNAANVEELMLKVAGLENLVKSSEVRVEEEMRARRLAEDELAEHQRRVRFAELDAEGHRLSAEEAAQKLKAHHEEHSGILQHTRLLEASQETLQRTVAHLTEKNAALESTLEEYRISHKEWREEIDAAQTENKNLDRTIHALKLELEDGIRGRQSLRDKFDRLQEDLRTTAHNLARDGSAWRYKEEEYKARQELQGARLEAEARTRERLEREIERLETQEKEAMKARFLVEQVQGEKARLSDMVNELRTKNHEHQDKVAYLERELHNSKETSKLDIQRLTDALGSDKETAKAELQLSIVELESRLESARTDASNSKTRHQLMLEEASESKDIALREAAEAREAALQEHYRFHERTLEEFKALHNRALATATEENQRALKNAIEDKEMAEKHMNGRLALSDEKVIHYQDRVQHLEEKLEIAKSAAQAAVQAAQSARGMSVSTATKASMALDRGSDLPEKISPQALRESIMVLQEQLQERESQIESLENELSKVDKDAPQKIRDRDAEISWLRELLGVRTDDLQDIITTLSSPSYNRESVRDAVIRLKANMQMEQQERERAMAGGQTFPSLSTISNLASSPRSLPLAAAAAWGNWRKGQSSLGNLDQITNNSNSQTPLKSSPQGFFSGLLTPPSTNIRQTPHGSNAKPSSSSVESRPLHGYSTPRRQPSNAVGLRLSHEPPPATPPLLRTASYDRDAQDTHYSLDRYMKDDDSTVDSTVRSDREDGPFGPTIEA
jgi:DNA repair exonuclease SbcCD ATPase subunit